MGWLARTERKSGSRTGLVGWLRVPIRARRARMPRVLDGGEVVDSAGVGRGGRGRAGARPPVLAGVRSSVTRSSLGRRGTVR
ncbi:hypothetical protein GCM10012276_26320 [Nocardioides deserti]|nr:hypothetical protein GCM10012276_26320 [Nocardioides deserti]